jgi:hypothetical protein
MGMAMAISASMIAVRVLMSFILFTPFIFIYIKSLRFEFSKLTRGAIF